ncbi:cadherin-related family member 5 [Hippopotamus amphibius kiboko]|uniref:cadherin-related family member 5 n=1 Tax=Hippopotamus amphibius kiboko TaxID=575201 RepID=UPI002598DFB4|nr:cadherin-related family member 5 [Hippopotamus amphibius kiboko]
MGMWALLLLRLAAAAQAQVCSVNKNLVEVEENTSPGQPLLDIYVPDDQQVTLGPSSTRFAFRIQGTQLFLNMTPDYEENSMLQALLECKRGDAVVTQLRVFVSVLDVNDNPPTFPFKDKVHLVPEDTKVNSVIIPETELKAEDLDKNDILFYTLQEVTPGASSFFSLVGANRPELRLDRSLDFDRWPNMTFRLLVRDTREEKVEPSHTATATLVLEVQPADLRPPWFLPCTYVDGFVCIHAQYQGAVPTGHILPGPLILHPGPIYAVDGDRGVNQPITYSIIRGNENDTFSIAANSGNLTMAKSVASPRTFLLLVKGEQDDLARYTVTPVTVEALAASGSLPRFPQSLYRGTVALSSGAGVAVKDAAAPSQPLRIRAQDPEFPDLNSAITYRITNNSNFRMDGEAVLTEASLAQAGVFYAEVEAKNTVTSGTATTVVEVQVSEQEPTPTGPPGPTTSPEMAGTTRPSSGTTSEGPRPPEPSQASSTTSSGGDTGPHPSSGTTLRPPASSKPGGTPGVGTSPSPSSASPSGGSATRPSSGTTSEGPRPPEPSQASSTTSSGGDTGPHPSSGTTRRPPASSKPGGTLGAGTSPSSSSASPSGGSAQTLKPGTSPLTSSGPSRTPWSSGTPGTGGSSTAAGGRPEGEQAEDRHFSVVDMAALGGVLGALLLLALIALMVLVHKHYGHRLKCCCGKALEPQPQGFDNKAFLDSPDETNWAPAPSPSSSPVPPAPPEPKPPSPEAPSRVPVSPAVATDGGSPAAVRSILTKERRLEGGYKAVWFGKDIGAEADVVVLNTPASEADGAGDSGSEGSGDEDTDVGLGRGAQDVPGSDFIYF